MRTLRYGQNKIGPYAELRFLELFQTSVCYVRVAVDEEDANRPASVNIPAIRTDFPQIGLDFALC